MDYAKTKTRSAHLLACGLAVIAATGLLYFFAPEQNTFYPRCLLHSLTGLNCPFCGGLRAAHQLLHGNLTAAFHLNPLLVLAFPPVFSLLLISKIVFAMTGKKMKFTFSPLAVWLFVGALAIFAVMRNTSAFSWMAP